MVRRLRLAGRLVLNPFRSLGERLSKDQYETAVSERNVFGNWMRDVLLPQPPKGRNFDKILVMPSGRFEPSYRNVYDGSVLPRFTNSNSSGLIHCRQTLEEGARRKQGFGFKDQALSVLTGLPFFTIPSNIPPSSLVIITCS